MPSVLSPHTAASSNHRVLAAPARSARAGAPVRERERLFLEGDRDVEAAAAFARGKCSTASRKPPGSTEDRLVRRPASPVSAANRRWMNGDLLWAIGVAHHRVTIRHGQDGGGEDSAAGGICSISASTRPPDGSANAANKERSCAALAAASLRTGPRSSKMAWSARWLWDHLPVGLPETTWCPGSPRARATPKHSAGGCGGLGVGDPAMQALAIQRLKPMRTNTVAGDCRAGDRFPSSPAARPKSQRRGDRGG